MNDREGKGGPPTVLYVASVPISQLTSVQRKLADAIVEKFTLQDFSGSKKEKGQGESDGLLALWRGFPQGTPWYSRHLAIFGELGASSLQAVVEALLQWLPRNSRAFAEINLTSTPDDYQRTKFGFDAFLTLIKNYTQDLRQWDLLEVIVDMVIAQLLAAVMRHYDGQNVADEIVRRLEHLVFEALRFTSPRKLHLSVWNHFRVRSERSWLLVLECLSVHRPCSLIAAFTDRLSGNRLAATPPEDVLGYLRGLRHVRIDIRKDDVVQRIGHLVDCLLAMWDPQKKPSYRVVLLKGLQCVFQQIDLGDSFQRFKQDASFSRICEEAQVANDLAARTHKDSSLAVRAAALQLAATILVKGPQDFYEQNIDSFLKRHVLSIVRDPKKKDYALSVILQVLRGEYIPRTLECCPPRHESFRIHLGRFPQLYMFHKFAIGTEEGEYGVYGCIMREGDTEDTMFRRLNEIYEELFEKKTLPNLIESIDVLAEIVVQMASHSLEFVASRVLPFLIGEQVRTPEYWAVGVRALRIMLDPFSGFSRDAALTPNNEDMEEDFRVCVVKLAYSFTPVLLSVFRQCEAKVGLDAMGIATEPSEQRPYQLDLDIFFSERTESESTQHSVHQEDDLMDEEISSLDLTLVQRAPTPKFLSTREITSAVRQRSIIEGPEIGMRRIPSTLTEDGETGGKRTLLETRLPAVSEERENESFPGKVLPRASKADLSRSPEAVTLLHAFREALRCIPMMRPLETIMEKDSILCGLILHTDPDIVRSSSYWMQRMVAEDMGRLSDLLEALCDLSRSRIFTEVTSIGTIISQIICLLSLYQERLMVGGFEAVYTGQHFPRTLPINDEWMSKLDSVALCCLGNSNAEVRGFALRLATSVRDSERARQDAYFRSKRIREIRCQGQGEDLTPVSSESDTTEYPPTLMDVLEMYDGDIIRNAAALFKLEEANGVLMPPIEREDDPPSAIRVATTDSVLWPFCLSEIAKYCLEKGCLEPLIPTRKLLYAFLCDCSADVLCHNEKLAHTWLNCNVLVMAMAGVLSSPLGNLSPKQTMEARQTHPDIYDDVQNFAFRLLGALLHDVPIMTEAVVLSCGFVHWENIVSILRVISEWYHAGLSQFSKKAQRMCLGHLCRIVRALVQQPHFPYVIHVYHEVVHLLANFIQENELLLNAPERKKKSPKTSDIQHRCNYAVLVFHVCCTLSRPLNGYDFAPFTREDMSGMWPPAMRYQTFATLKAMLDSSLGLPVDRDGASTTGSASATTVEEEDIPNHAPEIYQRASGMALSALLKWFFIYRVRESDELSHNLPWMISADALGFPVLSWGVSLFCHAILPELATLFYESLPHVQDAIIHAICDQYVREVGMQGHMGFLGGEPSEHTIFPDRTRRLQDDESFRVGTATNGGLLLHLGIYNLVNASSEIRLRALELLQCVAPFIVEYQLETDCQRRAQDLAAVIEAEKIPIQSDVRSVILQHAVRLSTVIATNCFQWAESIFSQSFAHMEATSILSAEQAEWTTALLLPWCKTLQLTDEVLPRKGTIVLEHETTNGLLHGLLHLSIKVSTVASMSPWIELWENIATAAPDKDGIPSNLPILARFSLQEAGQAVHQLPVCLRITVHLYRIHADEAILPLVFILSFSRWREESVRIASETRREMEAQGKEWDHLQEMDLISKKMKALSDSLRQWRQAAVTLLGNLVLENVTAFLTHLPIVLNHALFHQEEDRGDINILISNLLLALVLQTRDKEPDYPRRLLESMEALSSNLRQASFQLDWSSPTESQPKAPEVRVSHGLRLERPRAKRKSLRAARDLGAPGDDHFTTEGPRCNVRDVILLFEEYLVRYMPDVIEKWGKNALNWALHSMEPPVVIRSLQVYRLLLTPVTSQTVQRMVQMLLKIMKVEERRWLQDHHMENPVTIQLTVEILRTLKSLTAVMGDRGKIQQHPALFWTAAALLRSGADPIFQQSLELLFTVFQYPMAFPASTGLTPDEDEEEDACARLDDSTFISFAQGWNPAFEGIQPILVEGLLDVDTVEATLSLLVTLSTIRDDTLVDRRGSIRFLLNVTALLPWMYELLQEGAPIPWIRDDLRIGNIGLKLSEAARLPNSGLLEEVASSLEDVFREAAEGEFDTQADLFLEVVCSNLAHVFFPTGAPDVAEFLTHLLRDGPEMFHRAILRIVQSFLLQDSATEYLDTFKDLIKIASFKTDGDLRDPALDLLDLAMDISMRRGDRTTISAASQPLPPLMPRDMWNHRNTSHSVNALQNVVSTCTAFYKSERERRDQRKVSASPNRGVEFEERGGPTQASPRPDALVPPIPGERVVEAAARRSPESPDGIRASPSPTTVKWPAGRASPKYSPRLEESSRADGPPLVSLLHDRVLYPFFRDFVTRYTGPDLLDFYYAINDYTSEHSNEMAALKLGEIILLYVGPNAIRLPENVRTSILHKYEGYASSGVVPLEIFDEAFEFVATQFGEIIYPKFVQSPECQQLIDVLEGKTRSLRRTS